MSWDTVSTAMIVLVKTIDGVPDDNVFDRIVMYQDQKEFKDRFYDDTNERYCGVEIFTIADDDTFYATSTLRTGYNTRTRIFMQIKDRNDGNETYNILKNLAEDIRELYRKSLTVGGTCDNADMPAMSQVTPGLRQGIYTWECAIDWTVFERSTILESLS